MTGMTVSIALLRGVNIGPHRRVAMADVRAALKHFYLWCPNGISKSPYFTVPWDKLGVASTQRNWNTVTALLGLAR